MKAIFAVSALAAAISAQAIAADTESTWTWAGNVEYSSTFDLLNEDRTTGAAADGRLSVDVDVVNGGFSGSMSIAADDDDGDDNAEVSIGDLQYTEGAILFGQGIGSIVTTEASVGNMSDDVDYDAADGFRYTTDMGLTLQVEAGDTYFDNGNDEDDGVHVGDAGAVVGATDETGVDNITTDFGIAVAYATEVGGASIAADLQYREANDAPDTNDKMTRPYMGVKVETAVADMVDVTAGFTMGGSSSNFDKVTEDVDGGANTSSYGVRADVAVMEGVTAYAYYSANGRDGVNDDEFSAGATATFAPLTLAASHTMQLTAETATTEASADLSQDFAVSDALTVNAHANAAWETDADLDWSAGVDATYAVSDMTSAYAGVEVDAAGDGTEMKAGITHTTEGGASLSAEYTNRNDVFDDSDDDDNGEEHSVILTASYSF